MIREQIGWLRLKNELRKQLNSTDVLNGMDKLFDLSSETEIESLVSNFTNVIVNSSKKVVCVRNGQVSRKKQRNTVQKQKWFDRNCHSFKKELRNLGYLLFTTKKDYKRLVKVLKRNFQNVLENTIHGRK